MPDLIVTTSTRHLVFTCGFCEQIVPVTSPLRCPTCFPTPAPAATLASRRRWLGVWGLFLLASGTLGLLVLLERQPAMPRPSPAPTASTRHELLLPTIPLPTPRGMR